MKEKEKGLQRMLTEYFHLTKRNIKKEKDTAAMQTPWDVFENKQYDYDRTSVPSDDDIKIIAEVPPQEVSAWLMQDTSKTKSATGSRTSSISSNTSPVTQKEPVAVKLNDDKSERLVYDGSQVVAVQEMQEFDVKPEAAVKKEDDTCMEQPSQPAEDKPTERESFLMKQLEFLSKGFNEMKEIVNRCTTLPVKMNVVSKIKWKLQVGHPTVKSGKKEAKKKKKGSTDMKSKTATKNLKPSEEHEDKSDGNSKLTSKSELSTVQPIQEQDKNPPMEQKEEELGNKEKEIKEAEEITQNNQHDFDTTKNRYEDQNQHEHNQNANLNKEHSTSEVSTAQNDDQSLHEEQSHCQNDTQMSEQITESEAVRVLCSTQTEKEVLEKNFKTEKEFIDKNSEKVATPPRSTEIGIEEKSVMPNESLQCQADDEQFKISNITGGLKRMSVEVQGESKAKAMKIEVDDRESLLLGGDNDMFNDDDYSESDEKLLDDGENLKLDENTSSSGSSTSFKRLEGEGNYSSEENVTTDDLQQTQTIHPGTENDFEDQVSEEGSRNLYHKIMLLMQEVNALHLQELSAMIMKTQQHICSP